ncbi:hypothetical protein [Pleomorphomonas sp. PLEO]|uniref:hypothetical protein n=1 Tax=Pleomorphomonas sp. PLEO TaxID=3239306 RepID=UPI00351DD43F
MAAIALALQLMLPMPRPAATAANAADICHSDPTAHHHDSKHGAPSGRAGCDWCMLCGKLGTAIGPLDPVADLPRRTVSPVAIFVISIDFRHNVSRPRAGPVGARAPPEIA